MKKTKDGDEETMNRLIKNCQQASDNVTCQILQWELDTASEAAASGSSIATLGQFDIVFGSDIIYEPTAVASLFQTARRHLRRHDSAHFLLAYTKRNVSIDIVLQEADQAGLACVLFPPEYEEGIYIFKYK